MYIEKKEWFQEHGYKIARPRCYEGGNKDFFSASFEAANNLERLVDELRNPIWEMSDNNEDSEEFEITVAGLLSEKISKNNPSDSLRLSRKSLEKLIGERIYEGISA